MAVTGSFRLAPALINYDVTFRWAVGYTRQIAVVGLVARFFLLFDVVFVLCPLSSIKETGGCVPRRVSGSGSLIYLSRKLEKRTPGQVTCLTAPRLTRLCKTGAPIISGDAREGARREGVAFGTGPWTTLFGRERTHCGFTQLMLGERDSASGARLSSSRRSGFGKAWQALLLRDVVLSCKCARFREGDSAGGRFGKGGDPLPLFVLETRGLPYRTKRC